MWSRDRAVINFGNCAPQKSCKRHSLLHASLQLVTFQYWTSAKKKKIDLERPQTSADQRNIEDLCSERKMEKRRLPTHNRYLWGNSFVYSLKTTHCFFIYNVVIDIVYAPFAPISFCLLFQLRCHYLWKEQKLKIMENWFSGLMFPQHPLLFRLTTSKVRFFVLSCFANKKTFQNCCSTWMAQRDENSRKRVNELT